MASLVYTDSIRGQSTETFITNATQMQTPLQNKSVDSPRRQFSEEHRTKSKEEVRGEIVQPLSLFKIRSKEAFQQNTSSVESKLDRIESRLLRLEDEACAAWRSIGQKLDTLLRHHDAAREGESGHGEAAVLRSHEHGFTTDSFSGTKDNAVLDRKRLKERLKDAAAEPDGARAAKTGHGCTYLAEYILGIRAADARAGKERSRCGVGANYAFHDALHADRARIHRRPAAGLCTPTRTSASVRLPQDAVLAAAAQ